MSSTVPNLLICRSSGFKFHGDVLGDERFIESAIRKFDRRKRRSESRRRRIQEHDFEPAEKVIRDFEKRIGRGIKKIDTSTRAGTRLRDELLVLLKERADLTKSSPACGFALVIPAQGNS